MDISKLKKHLFIVIGYEHYTPLGAIRSLGENGIYPIVITVKSDIRITSVSRYIKKLYLVDDYNEAYEILLRDFSQQSEKPFIIPCDDNITELLDSHYEVLKESFYFSNAGENGRITKYMNKKEICDLAIRHGLNVAKSWVVKKGEIPENLVFPIITKPITSYPNWKADYHICADKGELISAYNTIKGEEILLQQYISKVNELCLDGVVINAGKQVLISIASRYTYILPDYFSMEMNITNLDDKAIQSMFDNMFAEIGYEGIFSAEFMIDADGKLWFLEINFRNSTWSYASTKLGMNLPLLWADGILNGHYADDALKTIPTNYIALAEVDDYEHRVKRLKMISMFTWLKGVFRADCLFYWNKHDMKPTISYWKGKILRLVKKKLKRRNN